MFLGYDNVGAFLEAIRPWVSPAALLAILGVVVRWQLGLRKLKIQADQVEVSAQEVSNKDEADIRDHYADEVRQLRERMDRQSERHREILQESDRKHEECQKDRERLREDSSSLKDIVRGLIRIITQASASQAIFLGPEASAEIRAAAKRVESLFVRADHIHPDPTPKE